MTFKFVRNGRWCVLAKCNLELLIQNEISFMDGTDLLNKILNIGDTRYEQLLILLHHCCH